MELEDRNEPDNIEKLLEKNNQLNNDENNNIDKNTSKNEHPLNDLYIDQIKIERNLKNDKIYDKSIKIILLGDSSVGKTSIIRRLCKGDFEDNLLATLSIECYNYIIKINDFIIRMQLWDTVGQELYNSIISNYYRSTDVAIFVYSVDNKKSFENIQKWFDQMVEKNTKVENNNLKCVLLGNKTDLEREISFEQGEKYANENNFLMFKEISCKKNSHEDVDNIIEIFDVIGNTYYIEKIKNKNNTMDITMSYAASDSIIELGDEEREEKKEKEKNEKKEKKSKCC